MSDQLTSDNRKWRMKKAFLWGAGIGLAVVAINLLQGTDFAAGTDNGAQAGGAMLTPFIMPIFTGLIGLLIAWLRNLFVR